MAYGSLMEVETQIQIADRLRYAEKSQVQSLLSDTQQLGRMLNGLKRSLRNKLETEPSVSVPLKPDTENPKPDANPYPQSLHDGIHGWAAAPGRSTHAHRRRRSQPAGPLAQGLPPADSGERLNEAASRAWNESLAAWKSFRKKFAALPASDTGTTLTRDEWLLPLFQELGYGRLQPKRAIVIDGKEYPISHG